MEIEIKSPHFLFGSATGSNVNFSTFVNLGIKKLGDINYLIFDELKLEANFDVEIS